MFAFVLLSGCGSAEPKQNKELIKKESIKKENKDKKFDFRNSNWGMSQQDISKIEIDKDIFEIPDETPVAFYEEISGINFLVKYKFDNNKLVSGSYLALGKLVTEENGEKLKKILYEKYGKEQRIESNGKIYWKSDDTEIEFSINLEDKKLTMIYNDIKYFEAKKVEEEKNKIEESTKKEEEKKMF